MSGQQLDLFGFDDSHSIFSLIDLEYLPKEYYEIEYKSAKEGFPKDFWKTYSAYANTNTGIIILGVSEKQRSFTIEGLTDEQIEKYKKQFWDDCNNPNSISRNLLENSDVRVIVFRDKICLHFGFHLLPVRKDRSTLPEIRWAIRTNAIMKAIIDVLMTR